MGTPGSSIPKRASLQSTTNSTIYPNPYYIKLQLKRYLGLPPRGSPCVYTGRAPRFLLELHFTVSYALVLNEEDR